MNYVKDQKGFTVIEVIIVIAIITLSAALVVPLLPKLIATGAAKSLTFLIIGGLMGSATYLICLYILKRRSHSKLRGKIYGSPVSCSMGELDGQKRELDRYIDRVCSEHERIENTVSDGDHPQRVSPLQYVLNPVKHVWNSTVDMFFRETKPPKQSKDL